MWTFGHTAKKKRRQSTFGYITNQSRTINYGKRYTKTHTRRLLSLIFFSLSICVFLGCYYYFEFPPPSIECEFCLSFFSIHVILRPYTLPFGRISKYVSTKNKVDCSIHTIITYIYIIVCGLYKIHHTTCRYNYLRSSSVHCT